MTEALLSKELQEEQEVNVIPAMTTLGDYRMVRKVLRETRMVKNLGG
jgi:hypothetical protein